MVELVLSLPLLALVLAGIEFMGRLAVIEARLTMSAAYGALLWKDGAPPEVVQAALRAEHPGLAASGLVVRTESEAARAIYASEDLRVSLDCALRPSWVGPPVWAHASAVVTADPHGKWLISSWP